MTQTNEFFKSFSDFKAPAFDFNALITTQRRNLEMLVEAGQLLGEGAQAVLRHNAEALKNSVESSLKASKEVFTGTSPEAAAAKQAEFAKAAFENGLAHLREVAETFAKSSNEALDIINKRVSESLEELGSNTKTYAKKK